MAAYATVTEYANRAGLDPDGLTALQTAQIQAYLDDVSARIRSRLARDAPAGYEPDPTVARSITIAVVQRTMANPGGRKSITVGGYSETLNEYGGQYVTDAEWADLLPAGDAGDGAYSVVLADDAFGTAGCGPDRYLPPYGYDRGWWP